MAVNDTPLEMTAANMPITIGNTLYVPYTMLSPQVTGVDLGVRAQYSSGRRVLTVSDDSRSATFDLQANTAYNSQGGTLGIRAVARGSMVYLPVAWISVFFPSIRYSLTRTAYGTLVRLTNSSVILTDGEFVDAAMSLLQDNLDRYQASLQPNPSPSVTPEPSPSPSPSPSPEPVPQVRVCLALRAGEQTEAVLDAAQAYGVQLLVLFAVDELAESAPLLRRVIAGGHCVGLALDGEDADACLAELEEGRALLAALTCTGVSVISADALSAEGREALRDAGCALWQATLGSEGYSAAALASRLHADRLNCLTIFCGAGSAAQASSLLRLLSGGEYLLLPAAAALV